MYLLIALMAFLSASEAPKPVPAKDLVPIMALEYNPAFRHGCKYTCTCLTNDYGYYIDWPDNTEPEIYIFEKKPARIAKLDSMDKLLAWAEKLPEGAKLDDIRSCGLTRAGMPPEKLKQLDQIFTQRKIHLADQDDGNFTLCICESKSRTMFKNIDEARKWIADHPGTEYYVAGKKATPTQ